MTTTLDNRGAVIPLNTRQGIDFRFEIGVDDSNGNPMDLTTYTVVAQLDDGSTTHDLLATVAPERPDTIQVHITAALTAALPQLTRYSVEIIGPAPDSIRSSLAYGPVNTDGNYP